MLLRAADYYRKFQCLAGACPHTCCAGWEVVLDAETAALYQRAAGPLGERLRTAMSTDEEGDCCFSLHGGRCPFLDGAGLCEIHRELGQAATSVTCREHPRFTEDYGAFREITLAASCPAANELLLGSAEPLRFVEWETEEPQEKPDAWMETLLLFRQELMAVLADRTRTIRQRLGDFLRLGAEQQAWLDETELPELYDTLPVLPENALRFLAELETLEEDWPRALAAAPAASGGGSAEQLERTAVYFAFRYLLKAVNDGDLLSRVRFVVFSVLTVERLAGLLGLPEALRRYSCEIEHSAENMERLLAALSAGELCMLPGTKAL